jgi:hypothetical protein
VERDLDFAPPPPRRVSGVMFVPMMRISIIQMEVVVMALHEQLLDSFKV